MYIPYRGTSPVSVLVNTANAGETEEEERRKLREKVATTLQC